MLFPFITSLRFWAPKRGLICSKVLKYNVGSFRKLFYREELVLVLMKLRQDITSNCLAYIFGISTALCSRLLHVYIPTMAKVLGPLIHWPDKADIKRFMPKHFSDVYPDLRATLDCTEFFLQQPRNRSAQHDCWSDYKKHCTVKYLVAIAPDGTITFVSKGYGGRASDRFIVNDSGILDKFDTGDTILADRGFTINDLLLPRLISLQIPPASSGWDQYLMKDVKKTKK